MQAGQEENLLPRTDAEGLFELALTRMPARLASNFSYQRIVASLIAAPHSVVVRIGLF
jgi:hypothetical protein